MIPGFSVPSSRCNVQRYATSENKAILPYSRRDYFKIWVVDGESMLHYASKSIHITQPALIFSNPLVPYSFERLSESMSGYIFIFTDDFFKENNRQESVLQWAPARSRRLRGPRRPRAPAPAAAHRAAGPPGGRRGRGAADSAPLHHVT